MWGPLAWHLLHCITLTAPEKPKRALYIQLFSDLSHILPCVVCREHYKGHLKQIPIDKNCGSRKELALWLFNLHNSVNFKLNKPIIPVNKAIKLYIEDDKLLFNRKKGFLFMDLIAKKAGSVRSKKRFEPYKRFFLTMAKLFPCTVSRKKLAQLCKVGKVNQIENGVDLKRWYIGMRDQWQKENMYKGCRRLVECELKNDHKSINYNLKLAGKKYLIGFDQKGIKPTKLLGLEYVPKREGVDIFGQFHKKDGGTCKRKLLEEMDKGIKLEKVKLTDVVNIDLRGRGGEKFVWLEM